MIKFSKNGKWQACWGNTPLPSGATALGTVTSDTATGALIHTSAGYFLGLSGSLQKLDQPEVKAAVARSNAASDMGRIGGKSRSAAKVAAVRKNSTLSPHSGRPRKIKVVTDANA